MTSLERVRNDLAFRCACPWKPAEGLLQHRPHTKSCGAAIIDAHLEEDAERQREFDEWVQNETAGHDEEERRLEAELAELKEAVRALSYSPTFEQVGRLRQLIEEKPMTSPESYFRETERSLLIRIEALEAELAELREAVREHIDGNGAPNRTHDRLRQLIEED